MFLQNLCLCHPFTLGSSLSSSFQVLSTLESSLLFSFIHLWLSSLGCSCGAFLFTVEVLSVVHHWVVQVILPWFLSSLEFFGVCLFGVIIIQVFHCIPFHRWSLPFILSSRSFSSLELVVLLRGNSSVSSIVQEPLDQQPQAASIG